MERKEPNMGSMVPSRDEHESRPAQKPASAPQPAKRPETPPPAPKKGDAPAQQAAPLLAFSFLVAVLGLGLAAFTTWQWVQASEQAKVADQRIQELEQRLTMSDDESTQSVSVLQANLKEAKAELALAHTEIRKLWDARNAHKQEIAAHDAKIAATEKELIKAVKQASEAQKISAGQDEKLKTLTNDIALQAEKLNLVSDLSDAQQKKWREIVDKSAQLQRQQSELTTRIARSEEIMQSIDAFRLNTNRELLDIKRNLGLAK